MNLALFYLFTQVVWLLPSFTRHYLVFVTFYSDFTNSYLVSPHNQWFYLRLPSFAGCERVFYVLFGEIGMEWRGRPTRAGTFRGRKSDPQNETKRNETKRTKKNRNNKTTTTTKKQTHRRRHRPTLSLPDIKSAKWGPSTTGAKRWPAGDGTAVVPTRFSFLSLGRARANWRWKNARRRPFFAHHLHPHIGRRCLEDRPNNGPRIFNVSISSYTHLLAQYLRVT